jgi:hypothetical protein
MRLIGAELLMIPLPGKVFWKCLDSRRLRLASGSSVDFVLVGCPVVGLGVTELLLVISLGLSEGGRIILLNSDGIFWQESERRLMGLRLAASE